MASVKEQREILQKLSQSAASWILAIDTKTLRDLDAPRNKDGTYNARDVHAWQLARKMPDPTASDDPLLAGANSPYLEEYRKQKAREAKRKNDEAEGKLGDISLIAADLAEIARVFQEEAEAIARIHGDEVGDAIRIMVKNTEKSWRERIEKRVQGDSR